MVNILIIKVFSYIVLIGLITIAVVLPASAKQDPDFDFVPEVISPLTTKGSGPRVAIDEAHFNYHTANGRFKAFSQLLREDGYRVNPNHAKFSSSVLNGMDILVISNALANVNVNNWILPNPSAFETDEIDAVVAWVKSGGALLLIADHMPFPGAASKLAERFGVLMGNGYAIDIQQVSGNMIFSREAGSLIEHTITQGRNPSERINKVHTFTGHAFRMHPKVDGEAILILNDSARLYLPVFANAQFSEKTPRISAAGFLQGAAIRYYQGRVAVFGEAAMFTAQRVGKSSRPIGMNHPQATDNQQFVLNVVHWLSDELD